MPTIQLLDTFPEFEKFWRSARFEPIDVQIERWEREYMAPWPELLKKLKQSYAEEGADWKRIARTKVFPYLAERMPRMRRLHRNLLRILPGDWRRTKQALKLDFKVRFVIYVGIGVGAGWATEYGGMPACLFGIENAAGYASGADGGYPASIAHEVAHIAHNQWRLRNGMGGIEGPRSPYWHLYEEGFATECERRILDTKTFRMRTGRKDWLPWCESHRSWLAKKFLHDTRARKSIRPFFGSWYNIHGYSECGYFLGAEIIREWTKSASLMEVATLSEAAIRKRARATLDLMARQ
jgi:hypothetical protein